MIGLLLDSNSNSFLAYPTRILKLKEAALIGKMSQNYGITYEE